MWEIQTLIDWTSTKTTLLFHKFVTVEEVKAALFNYRCDLDYERLLGMKRGQKLPFAVKAGTGATLLFIIIVIVWGPLLLGAARCMPPAAPHTPQVC